MALQRTSRVNRPYAPARWRGRARPSAPRVALVVAAALAALVAGLLATGCASKKLTVVYVRSDYTYRNQVTLRDARAVPERYPALFEPRVESKDLEFTYTLKDAAARADVVRQLRADPKIGVFVAEIRGEKGG